MISTEKAVPVPTREKILIMVTMALLFSAAVFIGTYTAPSGDIPVALADGKVITPPYYITIDGKKAVLVESKDTAQKVVNDVIDEYKGNVGEVLDIQILEETSIEKMDIRSGDEMPDILTEQEAKAELMSGDDGKGLMTVVITSEKNDIESVGYEEEYKPSPDMYVGETKVETKGEKGFEKVTSVIVSENGEEVNEKVVETETIKEPVRQIVLKGTKSHDGRGGGRDAIDVGVSYDEEAVYSTLYTPVSLICISSPFGPRWGGFHSGLDLALAQGNDIYAADGGTVYYAGYCGGYGNLVKIDHGNGMQTYYAHCSSLLVHEGYEVERGQRIALVGSTGNSTGPHLHFEVIINGTRVDPMDFLEIK